MNKLTASLVSMLICFSAVAGQEEKNRLVLPKGSNLTIAKIERKSDLYAKFNGQVSVTGTLVARWIGGTGSTASKAPDFVLVPDATSINQLPYFVLKDPPYFVMYKVRTIEIQNGPDALRMAVGAEKAERLIRRKMLVLKVTGSFLLERYVVGVECDAPWARAIVIKAEIPEPEAVAGLRVPEGC